MLRMEEVVSLSKSEIKALDQILKIAIASNLIANKYPKASLDTILSKLDKGHFEYNKDPDNPSLIMSIDASEQAPVSETEIIDSSAIDISTNLEQASLDLEKLTEEPTVEISKKELAREMSIAMDSAVENTKYDISKWPMQDGYDIGPGEALFSSAETAFTIIPDELQEGNGCIILINEFNKDRKFFFHPGTIFGMKYKYKEKDSSGEYPIFSKLVLYTGIKFVYNNKSFTIFYIK